MIQDKRDFLQRMIRNLEKVMLKFTGLDLELHFEEMALTIDKYLVEVLKVNESDSEEEITLKMMDLSSKTDFKELELLTDVLIYKGKFTQDKKYLSAAYKILSEIEQKDLMTFSFVRQQKLTELQSLIQKQ
ncbi:hypothetical protein [Flammeovirga sp. SJP92]|uniref:hypothetical protein n=1 Tax=Flammeovirga sp. SJP92 TaxID=1775430 RepID=UPI00078711DE|nr:hypothetical protein [Flammeovirga sp. SJP92]KXX71583.1 hypothetical protein AVL50_04740 [Flammeovirga sp. SJP92]